MELRGHVRNSAAHLIENAAKVLRSLRPPITPDEGVLYSAAHLIENEVKKLRLLWLP